MLVGISGLAGSGKDQTATYLIEDHGFCRVSLADPLKRICRDVFAFTDEQLWGPSQFRNAPDTRYPRPDGTFLAPREALQTLGTEWGRSCYPNTWVELCIRTAKALLAYETAGHGYSQQRGVHGVDTVYGAPNPIRGVAVPDVRFRNELQAIKDAGGKVIRVVRPGAGLSGGRELHPSETEQASIQDHEFDFVIENSGTLEDLRTSVTKFMVRQRA